MLVSVINSLSHVIPMLSILLPMSSPCHPYCYPWALLVVGNLYFIFEFIFSYMLSLKKHHIYKILFYSVLLSQ